MKLHEWKPVSFYERDRYGSNRTDYGHADDALTVARHTENIIPVLIKEIQTLRNTIMKICNHSYVIRDNKSLPVYEECSKCGMRREL